MGGYVYHVLNRAVGRATLFAKATDYEAFVRVLAEALDWVDIRLLAYCVMPNHWHLVVWPERDGDLSEFMRWLTLTHTQRWHAKHHTQGTGPLCQGRFKTFPVAKDEHCLRVLRRMAWPKTRSHLAGAADNKLSASRRRTWASSQLWRCRHNSPALAGISLPSESSQELALSSQRLAASFSPSL
jgi:putative transposase